jgi:hypothetical protein
MPHHISEPFHDQDNMESSSGMPSDGQPHVPTVLLKARA